MDAREGRSVRSTDGIDRNVDAVCRGMGMHIEELRTPPREIPFDSRRRLLYAVLRQAFTDLEDPDGVIRQSALDWFEGDDGEGPFDFATICDELSLTRQVIRAGAYDQERRRTILKELADFGRSETAAREDE